MLISQVPSNHLFMKRRSEKTPVVKKEIIKKLSSDEAKIQILKLLKVPEINLQLSLQDLGNNVLPYIRSSDEIIRDEARANLLDKGPSLMRMLEVDTQWNLAEVFDERYRGMVMEMSKQIIKEYDCATHAEKMLAEIVVNSFARVLDSSRRLDSELGNAGTVINENRTKYLSVLSKLHDRSNRQFLSAIMTLKQMKAPSIEMNIKANTAFIAQNQQVNTVVSSDEKL